MVSDGVGTDYSPTPISLYTPTIHSCWGGKIHFSMGARDWEADQAEDREYVVMQGIEVKVMLKIKYLKYWLQHNNSLV